MNSRLYLMLWRTALICFAAAAAACAERPSVAVPPAAPAQPIAAPVAQAKPAHQPLQEKVPRVTAHAQWTSITGVDAPQLAVELTPAPGWHIYWHSPGDTGLATAFELLAPRREQVAARMPAPKRKVSAGDIVSYGFDGATTFFLQRPSAPLESSKALTLEASWLACAEICIKGSKKITVAPADPAALKPKTATDKAWQALPVERSVVWKRAGAERVYEGPTGSTVRLFPHAALHLRLDGLATPYCRDNLCRLPAELWTKSPTPASLLATLHIETASGYTAVETDLMKGNTP